MKSTKKTDPSVPGPGTYVPKNFTVGTEGRNFNFQGRSKNFNGKCAIPKVKYQLRFCVTDPEVITKRSNIPGPGTYEEVICITKYGQSPLSTISNSRAANWSPSKQRFAPGNQSMRDTPGPGQYTPSDCVSGNYVLSTTRNGGSIKMIRDTKPGRARSRHCVPKIGKSRSIEYQPFLSQALNRILLKFKLTI